MHGQQNIKKTRKHIYIYICIYIYTHTYIHTHIYTYIYVYTYTHIHICTHIYTYICIYIHIYTHTYIHTHIYIYTHTHTHTDKDTERIQFVPAHSNLNVLFFTFYWSNVTDRNTSRTMTQHYTKLFSEALQYFQLTVCCFSLIQ